MDIHDIEIILYEDTQLTNEPNNPLSTTRPRLNCRNPTFRRFFSLVIIAIINTLRFVLLNNYIVSLYSSNLLFLKFIRIIHCIILLFVKFLKTCYIIFFNILSNFIHYFFFIITKYVIKIIHSRSTSYVRILSLRYYLKYDNAHRLSTFDINAD